MLSFRIMHDTTREAAAVQADALRRLSPEARVAMALEASEWLRRLARVRTEGALTIIRPDRPTVPAARTEIEAP